jgi:hypothetical protein
MTKRKAKEWECKQHFSKGFRFSTLLVVAGCYLIMRFVITVQNYLLICEI